MNGGKIAQAEIPALFESEFNGAIITSRQAEESVKRTVKLGRIKVEAFYSSPEGKRIIINRLPIGRSIANT
jgi:3-deoxy-D-manno-octulosonate 8-phosphate phosphatase KdsC-like HAD superfamily phosphatase